MDAFEARLQFLQVIKNLHKTLNASKDNSPLSGGNQQQNDPVSFYLRHYEHHYEDFQQCMLDSTAKMDSLDRLNVLIYWSRLISMLWPRCMKGVDGEQNTPGKVVYGHLLGQLDEIVSLVLPAEDWKALTNLNVCADIIMYLNRLCQVLEQPPEEQQLLCSSKQLLETQDMMLTTLQDQQALELPWYHVAKKSQTDFKQALISSYQLLIDRRKHAVYLQELYRINGICAVAAPTSNSTVLHRMENDRERHKKSKEHLWFTERNFILDSQEFDSLWSSCKGMTKNDYTDIRDLNKIAHNSYMYN
ncbi:LANO_0F14048g1_1 [Lachancea nothofagi CBS 11611]|uniref:LANO_0F14048g1_1 n=1 Tax=Lachancea nothofagi CBS 11611 TaxID=1266666 RepID=A0A1G4KC11_9SACH|nr:LANO_0F14048g1_1 [Lachancea nothofagi CBS 11611]